MEILYDIQLNRDLDWQMKRPHFHEGFEVVLLLSGEGGFFIGERIYPVKRGTLLLLNDTVLHRSNIMSESIYERYIIHFSRNTLASISSPKSDLCSWLGNNSWCTEVDEEQLESLVAMIEACRKEDKLFGDDLRRYAIFMEFILRLCGFTGSKGGMALSISPQDMTRIAPILEYIRLNITEDLSLDRLAEAFYINKYHLSRIFKAATGFTICEYIIQYRVQKARNLLRGGMAVQSAGEAAGFHNNAHFIRTFRSIIGESPGKYARHCFSQSVHPASRTIDI